MSEVRAKRVTRPSIYPILITPVTCDTNPRKIAPDVKLNVYKKGKVKCLFDEHTEYPSRLAAIMRLLDESDLPELVDIFYAGGTINQCLKQMQLIAERGLSATLPVELTRSVDTVYKVASTLCLKFNKFLEKRYPSSGVFIDVDELLFLTHKGAEKFFIENPNFVRDDSPRSDDDIFGTEDLDSLGKSAYETVEAD
jgi:hypothetical protein